MFNKTLLHNGVRVLTEQQPHTRLVSVGIWIDTGSRDEHDLNRGAAHFVEHMLFKGTGSRSARRIAKEFDVLGGTANAFTTRENTCYSATVVASRLREVVLLLADLFLDSRFRPEEVERERQVILQELSMVEDTPDDFIHDLFAARLWGDHPLGCSILGSREVLQALQPAHLLDFVASHYLPGRVVVAAAGQVKHEEFVGLWQRIFDSPAARAFNHRGAATPSRRPPEPQAAGRQILPRPQEQVHVVLGTPGVAATAAERYPYQMLNVLLGGNMSSRLFQEIRENRGLAYSVYSHASAYVDSGALSVYLGVEPGSFAEAVDVVEAEIQRLVDEVVGDEELDDLREYVKAGLLLSLESMEAVMARIARNELLFGRDLPLAEVEAAVDRVSGGEIQALARRLFGGGVSCLAALGPLTRDGQVDAALEEQGQ